MSNTPLNRTFSGTEDDDQYAAGRGDDALSGMGGADTLQGGIGEDYIEGGSGNDRLIGDDGDATISVADLITMQEDRDITVTFDNEGAGYRNTLGYYKVSPETGEIYDVGVLWENASLQNSGGDLVAGESSETISTSAGEQIGFFVVGNGFSLNDFSSLGEGRYEFRNGDGEAASADDVAPTLHHVGENGVETEIAGSVFHSAAYGERVELNADGVPHTVGLANSSEGVIQLGFEDLHGGGDKDYDDAVFSVDVGEATATVLNAHFQQNLSEETQNLEVINHASEMHPRSTNDRIHGEEGADTLEGMQGNDLLVGDRAGEEWSLVDGEWVYDPTKQLSGGEQDTHDDRLVGDIGNDVLNGGLGDDTHIGGAGDDRINAGEGRDFADGGDGADQINLEDGADTGVGGLGADTIHAGAGADVVYGDLGNVLDNGDYGADPHSGVGFSFLGKEGGWSGGEAAVSDDNVQTRSITQTMQTVEGEAYSMNFDLALGSLAAQGAASVEVYWNGELVDTIAPGSALFEQYTLNVTGTGGADSLEFREIIDLGAVSTTQTVYSSDSEIAVNGETVSVAGFAPGQANLYQVIGDELFVFDTQAQTYDSIGSPFGFNVNAAGFNPGDNLIYGFATGSGADVHGNAVRKHDLIAIDADGNAHRIGHAGFESEIGSNSVYIGDCGPDGALWVMNGGHRSEAFRVDVNNVDPGGAVAFETVPLPADQLSGFADWAWVENEQAFIGVARNGELYKIDPFNLTDGAATVTSIEVASTQTSEGVFDGLPKGSAWGAVFTDADGNLYAGLNNGDHDMSELTEESGGIYQITGFSSGSAQAVLLADAPTTSSNDGISDPRSISAFAETDGDASVLIKNVSLTGTSGDDDMITGGLGADRIFGEGGGDEIHGQEGADTIDGGVGDDVAFGGDGDDFVYGGEGADHLEGNAGADRVDGNDGDDVVMGGAGDDVLSGGAGADKLVGGAGQDRIEGGRGDDHMWGGEWSADGEADTFVFAPGSGHDMIHDFEAGKDVIDLTAYGVDWDDVQGAIQDLGWAVSIELGAIGGAEGDRVFLTNVSAEDLTAENFDLGA